MHPYNQKFRVPNSWGDHYPPPPPSIPSPAPLPFWIPAPAQAKSPDPPPTPTALNRSQVLRDWLELSSFHGVVELGRGHYGKVWKITWILVMIAFTALAVFNIKEGICQYISNPTVQNYQEEPEDSFPTPDIAVCTHERMNYSILAEMGASAELIEGMAHKFDMSDPMAVLRNGEKYVDQSNISQLYADFRAQNGNMTFEEIQRKAGFKCEEIVKACSWGSDSSSCCSKATPFLDRLNGFCYRFKTAGAMDRRQQTWPGADGGVQVAFAGVPGSSKEGVLVEFIHPNESNSFTYSQIPAGVVARAPLSLQVTNRINMMGRSQTCFESPHIESILDEGRLKMEAVRTTANGCYFVSWNMAVFSVCGCILLPDIAKYPLCEMFFNCPYENFAAINNEYLSLSTKCLPMCHRQSYSTSITYSKLNMGAYFKRFNRTSEASMGENLIVLNVFYPRMESLHVVETEVYGIMTTVSNIGGALGLWLGASLMSILQLIFYFCKWLLTCKTEKRIIG